MNGSAAARYARALFDVSLKEANLERVESELADFTALLEAHEALRRVLLNPAIPLPRRRAVISEILDRDGGTSRVVARFLLVLAERDRLSILPEILEAFRGRLMVHEQTVRAVVTTAVPVPPERMRAIGESLSRATGKSVTIEPAVDPGIIGGVVARIGSTVFDGSVARQLQRLRETLVQTA